MIYYYILMVLLVALMMALTPKMTKQKPPTVEEINVPSAAERPIQYLAGTQILSGPNTLWYSSLRVDPIIEKIKTMLTTTKTIVGYKYFLSMQLGICHGPDVKIREIRFGKE